MTFDGQQTGNRLNRLLETKATSGNTDSSPMQMWLFANTIDVLSVRMVPTLVFVKFLLIQRS